MEQVIMAIAAPLAKQYGIDKAIELAYEQLGLEVPAQSEIDVLTGGGITSAFAPTNLTNIAKRGAVDLGIRSLLGNAPFGPLAALGGIAFIGDKFNPLNPNARNYSPNLRGQLNYLGGLNNFIGKDPGTGLAKYGPGSVLAGKNVMSLFGSNNYQKALDKQINYFENQKKKKGFLTDFQQKKLDDTKKEKRDFFDSRADIRDDAKTKSSRPSYQGPTGVDIHGGNGGGSGGHAGGAAAAGAAASQAADDAAAGAGGYRRGGIASL